MGAVKVQTADKLIHKYACSTNKQPKKRKNLWGKLKLKLKYTKTKNTCILILK